MSWYTAQVDTEKTRKMESCKKQKQLRNNLGFDIEQHDFELRRVNVIQKPSISKKKSLLRLVAELEVDFMDKFPDARNFQS